MEQAMGAVWPLILSTGLITLNEMGDKSQFLAMAFAARMKPRKVLLGILCAVLALNAIAVAVGSLLASVPGWEAWIRFISSLLFLAFGLLALRTGDAKGESADAQPGRKRRRSYGDFAVVFASFFFSEMGDKTQLVTISLAAQYPSSPFLILAGTSLGMMIADGIGIFAGVIAHRRLPERALKILSAALFLAFGLYGVFASLRETFLLTPGTAFLITAALAAGAVTAAVHLVRQNPKLRESRR